MAEFVEEPIYAQLARIGKALANPVRLRLLDLLDHREFTVEQLATAAGVGLKNTSAQLQHLRAANLVTSRKDGTRVSYRLADPQVSTFLGLYQDFAGERRVRPGARTRRGVDADGGVARPPGRVAARGDDRGVLPRALLCRVAERRSAAARARLPRAPSRLRVHRLGPSRRAAPSQLIAQLHMHRSREAGSENSAHS